MKKPMPTKSQQESGWEIKKNEVNIASVDCTLEDSKEICEQFSIRGYPSLVLLKGSKYYKYRG